MHVEMSLGIICPQCLLHASGKIELNLMDRICIAFEQPDVVLAESQNIKPDTPAQAGN
jgi:hypothetical protein